MIFGGPFMGSPEGGTLKLWGAVCLQHFFLFIRTNFAPIWYLLRYVILQQYLTYCKDVWHITTICDILQRYMTYCSDMYHTAAICDISTAIWHIATICDISTEIWQIVVWHYCRTWEQLAPLGCFLFADLFRYHNNVMCVESLKRKDIFAPFLRVYYYYYLSISDTSGKHKQHEARSIVNNQHTKQKEKRISINNGQQCSLASLGYANTAGKELR